MSELFNTIKTSILGTKTANIDKDIDSSFRSIEKYSINNDRNKYLEIMKNIVTKTDGVGSVENAIVKSLQTNAQVQTYDQSGRIYRYNEYEAIVRKISYCQRALETLVDHIISPDDITKTSIQFLASEDFTDSATAKTAISRCNQIETKLGLENKIRKIVRTTLHKGDSFVEIIYSPKGENGLKILQESKNEKTQLIEQTEIEESFANIGSKISYNIPLDEEEKNVLNGNVIIESSTFTSALFENGGYSFGGVLGGMGSYTVGANVVGDRTITNKPFVPNAQSADKKSSEPNFKSKFDDENAEVPTDEDTELKKLKDIFIAVHKPQYVIRLETDRFKSCLGYLVFPKIDISTMLTNGSAGFNTGLNSVDSLCNQIISQLHGHLKGRSDDIKLSKDVKIALLTYLSGVKNGDDLKIRYVPPEFMCHWRLNADLFDPYGESIFECVNFDCRLLIALKTATTIKRLTYATDKRMISVETGLPRDAKNIIESIKEGLSKRKISVDTMGSIDNIPSQIPTFETIYVPMRDGKKFVEFDKMEWGMNPAEDIEPLKFLRDNIVANLGVPAPYLGLEENTCFSFNEKVPLLEGFDVTMGTLVEQYEKDPEHFNQWTYSIDPTTNDIVPGKILKAIRTRKNATMVKVYLDNGKSMEVTPDHLYMMRDGSYKEAKDLVENDSMMPWYIRSSNIKTKNNTPYFQVYHPGRKKWQVLHRMVSEGLNKAKINDGMHVHHIDGNPLNNHPNNLLVCSRDKHNQIHNEKCRYNHNDLSTYSILEKRNCVICQKEFECRIQLNQSTCLSESCKLERKRLDGIKSWERKKSMCGSDYTVVKANCSVCNKEFETYQKYLNQRTDKWITCGDRHCGRVAAGRKNTFRVYGDNSPIKLTCIICNNNFEINPKQEHKSNTCSISCMNTLLSRRRFQGNREISNCSFCGKEISITKYQKKHNQYIPCDNSICKHMKQGVKLWLNHNSDKNIEDYISLKQPMLNHKVVKVEWLIEKQDCCDLEIEKYHNFALSAGVFVHNSNRSLLTSENINFTRTIIAYQKELSMCLKDMFRKIYKLIYKDHQTLDKIQITFQEPKISPYEHQMEYVEQIQRLMEALKGMGVPMEYMKKKYLPQLNWEAIEKFSAMESLEQETNETPPDQSGMMGGGVLSGTGGMY